MDTSKRVREIDSAKKCLYIFGAFDNGQAFSLKGELVPIQIRGVRGNKLFKFLDLYLGRLLILVLSAFLRRPYSPIDPNRKFRKILVVKLAALGDTILLIPTLRSLRQRFPHAEVVMVGTSINAALIRLFPQYVDRFIPLDVRRALKNPIFFFSCLRLLRSEHTDIAFDFEQWTHVTPIILRLTRAPLRVGFRTQAPFRHLLYTHFYEREFNKHECENFIGVLTLLGIHEIAPQLELPVDLRLVADVKQRLAGLRWIQGQPIVIVHPGCGTHGFPREWPLSSYKQLCNRLVGQYNAFIVITGGPDEQHLTTELAGGFPQNSCAWNDSSLERFIALVSISRLSISGNNGAMHLFAALKVPQIALHGPTNKNKWGPLNPKAIVIESTCPECPCLDLGFEYHRTDGFCMAQISVEKVYAAATKILDQT
jgi:ADP-heptose:LPS heptosyltransferase